MIFLSLLCLIYTFIEGNVKYVFDRSWSSAGFQNFIILLLKYRLIYSGTILLAVGYAAVENLAVSKQSADYAKMSKERDY